MSKDKSLSVNSLFYILYQVTNVIFPFLSGMYVARVLAPDTIGDVAYAQNIVTYFVVFAFLGIPTYGMREVARTRNNKPALNKLYTELFIINLISTAVFSVVYYGMIFAVDSYRAELPLYSIVGLLLLLNALNISWLFEGLECFSYISTRNIIVKIASFLFLIVFVKNESDYLLYASILTLGTAGNYIANIVHSKRFVKFDFTHISFKRHMKSIVYLVVVNLAMEIYTMVDITMLGALCTRESVAYYSYASKINRIFLQILNALTVVVVPRLALYYEEGLKKYNELLSKTLRIVLILSVPLVAGVQFTAREMFSLLYGPDYVVSGNILKVLVIACIFSPVGYLLGSRVLLISGNESKMIWCVGIGAVVNSILNYVLIPMYSGVGTAIASVLGELVVMVTYVFFSRRYFHLENIFSTLVKVMAATALMSASLLWFDSVVDWSGWVALVAQVAIAVVVYGFALVLIREDVVLGALHSIGRRFKRL